MHWQAPSEFGLIFYFLHCLGACQRLDIYQTATLLKHRFLTDDCSESKIARDLSFSGSVHILIISSLYSIRNPTFLAAENRDFGRFVTTRYNVQCKHTRFFVVEFLGLLNDGCSEEAWFWGVRVRFGCREGALASALIQAAARGIPQFWSPKQYTILNTNNTRRYNISKCNLRNIFPRKYFFVFNIGDVKHIDIIIRYLVDTPLNFSYHLQNLYDIIYISKQGEF